MKKLVLILILSISFLFAHAQSWQIINSPQRFMRGLGLPIRDTTITGSGDTAQIVIRAADGQLYYRYKGYWQKAGGGSTPSLQKVTEQGDTTDGYLNITGNARYGLTNREGMMLSYNRDDRAAYIESFNDLSGRFHPIVMHSNSGESAASYTSNEFRLTDRPYWNNNVLWDSGNLKFGSGLNYNPATRTLTAPGGSGGAGIYTLSNSVTGNSVSIAGDNGSTTTFDKSDTRFAFVSPVNNQLLRYNSSTSKFENWTPNYITGNQTIIIGGDISGTGTTSINLTLPSINFGASLTPIFAKYQTNIKGQVTDTDAVTSADITPLTDPAYIKNGTTKETTKNFNVKTGKMDSAYVEQIQNEPATELVTITASKKLAKTSFKNAEFETLRSINAMQNYTGNATMFRVNDTALRNNGFFVLINKGSRVQGGDTLYNFTADPTKILYRVAEYMPPTSGGSVTTIKFADGLIKKYPGTGNITDTGTIGIINNGIALAKIAQAPGYTVLGNAGTSTGDITNITASPTALQLLTSTPGSGVAFTTAQSVGWIHRQTKDSLAAYTGGAWNATLFEPGRTANYIKITATGTNTSTKYDTIFMAGGVAWLRVYNTGNRYIYSSSFDNKWSSGLTGNADSGYSVVSTATSSLSGALRQTPGYQFVAQGSNSSAPAFTGRLRWVGEIGGNTWGNYVTLEGQTGSEAWSKMIRFWSGGLIYNDANANQTSILTPLIPGGTHTNEAYTFRLPYRNHNVLGRDQDTLALRSDTSASNPTHFATQYQLSQISGGSITVPGTANQIQTNNGSGALQASTATADASGNVIAPTTLSTSATPAFAAFYANQSGVGTSNASRFNFYGGLTTAFRRAFGSNQSFTLGANNNYVATVFGGESQAKPTSGIADLWATVGIKPQITSNPTANSVFKRSGTLTVLGRTPAADLKLPDSVSYAARVDSGGLVVDMMARLDTLVTATTVALSDVRTLWINKASSAATWTLPRLAISRYLDLELVNPTANAITLNNANGTSIINPKAAGGNVSSYTIPAYGAIRIHGEGDVSEWVILSISN